MQQHARPTAAEHDLHRTCRCRTGVQIRQCLLHRILHIAVQACFIEIRQIKASAAARAALFAPFALLGNHCDTQAHQRPDVGRMPAVQTRNVHQIIFAAQAGHHLHDARIRRSGQRFYAVEQRDFRRRIQAVYRVERRINRLRCGRLNRRHFRRAALRTDHPHGFRRAADAVEIQAVGIGKRRFFTRHRAYADALINLEAAGLHHPFFQMPAFKRRALAVDVGIIDLMTADQRQAAGQIFGKEAVGGQ